jgi:hypothetical protein
LCNVSSNDSFINECAVLDTSGRLYIWNANGESLYAPVAEPVPTLLYSFDTLFADTVSYSARIPNPAGMPACVNNTALYIPSATGKIFVLRAIDSTAISWDTIPLGRAAASYVCNYSGTQWAAGCEKGYIAFGNDTSAAVTLLQACVSGSIQAIAAVNPSQGIIAAINSEGVLTVCTGQNGGSVISSSTLKGLDRAGIYPPYSLAASDLENDGKIDIIVTDRKQGVWLYSYDQATKGLALSPEWTALPVDWAGAHRLDTLRAAIPDNASAPSLADIDGDNCLDILISGTNGVYAYNHRGVLLTNWPVILDTRYWYQRGSVTSSPVVGRVPGQSAPLVLFAVPTGEHVTFSVAKIYHTDPATGTIYYRKGDGSLDSLEGLSKSLIDSLLIFGDSLILPYVLPGGYIDAVDKNARRPVTVAKLSNVGSVRQSSWPLTVGGIIRTAPMLCDIDHNGNADIFAVSDGGMVYRWEFTGDMLLDSTLWPQTGAGNSRTFACVGAMGVAPSGKKPEIAHFYNFPNPVRNTAATSFKYYLSGAARKVTLDIFTYTGYHIVSESKLPVGQGWNEYPVSIKKFGSAVYRCRLEADFGGTKKVKYWKMAIIK